jgi:hypothetical protein
LQEKGRLMKKTAKKPKGKKSEKQQKPEVIWSEG